ncbi:MAG: hypothetical protein QNK19_09645 [Xanthomonadales bacterium]|nr:hypothetical protein [Xanthomonadales bacterium]
MKRTSKLTMILIAATLVLFVTFIWFGGKLQPDQMAAKNTVFEESLNSGSEADAQLENGNSTRHVNESQTETIPDPIGADFTYINSEYLKTNWETELGCYTAQDTSNKCENPELSAGSYEEAIWMVESGYPTASELEFIESLGDEELLSLSSKGYFLPTLILGQRAATNGDQTDMYSRFLLSRSQRLSPYSLKKMADSLVASADDGDNPQWAYRRAAFNLKTAELLGDYRAGESLDDLYQIVWGNDPSVSLIVSVNDNANLYLSRHFGAIKDLWPVTPRPRGG